MGNLYSSTANLSGTFDKSFNFGLSCGIVCYFVKHRDGNNDNQQFQNEKILQAGRQGILLSFTAGVAESGQRATLLSVKGLVLHGLAKRCQALP